MLLAAKLLIAGLATVSWAVDSKPVRLKFAPRLDQTYVYSVEDNEIGHYAPDPAEPKKDNSHPYSIAYEIELRFKRAKRGGYDMTSSTRSAKVAYDERENGQTSGLNTPIKARWDSLGRLLEIDGEKFDPKSSRLDYLQRQFTGPRFMDLYLPHKPIRKGSTWRVTIPGEHYIGDGEQIETKPGQKVRIDYKVEDVTNGFISISYLIDTMVVSNAWPVNEDYPSRYHENGEYVLSM